MFWKRSPPPAAEYNALQARIARAYARHYQQARALAVWEEKAEARRREALASAGAIAEPFSLQFTPSGKWIIYRGSWSLGRIFEPYPPNPENAERYEWLAYLAKLYDGPPPIDAWLAYNQFGPEFETEAAARLWLKEHLPIEKGERRRVIPLDEDGIEIVLSGDDLLAAEAVMV